MPRSRWATPAAAAAPRRGATICSAPGAPCPNACCSCAWPIREPSAFGTTLIDGIAVLRPRIGSASTMSSSAAAGPSRWAWRQSRSPQRAEGGEPDRIGRSASASIRGPSLASTAGSSVSVAASTKTTLSMIPSAVERNAGLGTSSTAERETRTVIPEKTTALPAVSIVTATASRTASRDPKSDARKRCTMNSA